MGIDKANKYNLQRAYGLSRKRKKEEKKQSRKKFRDIGKQQAKGEYWNVYNYRSKEREE